jgi:hypothetical protein
MERSIFPEIKILPTLKDVGSFMLRLISLPEGGYPSEYPKHPERRGAAAMLDAHLEDDYQPSLPFSPFIDRSRQ